MTSRCVGIDAARPWIETASYSCGWPLIFCIAALENAGDMTMQNVQVGFIGAGNFITGMHLPTVHQSENMDIGAIADLDEELLKRHSSNMPVGYTTTDYRKILDDPEIEMVIIGTKQDLHSRFIIESLDAGKWVLCEKPMAETEEESEAVLEAEKRNPGKLAIGFNRRFAPSYAETKRLMQGVKRPWYINYRLMYPNPSKQEKGDFYETQPRILYEGCHILDLVCWLLEDVPTRVFMTGDRFLNNCCILDYQDGSQVSFMCGSMGTYCLWKEYMEVFADWTAITVSELTDMRIRGFSGEVDRVYAPHRNERAREVSQWGFDFYEAYKVQRMWEDRDQYKAKYGMDFERIQRPTPVAFDITKFGAEHPDLANVNPDKGWIDSVEHFARCLREGTTPDNADGKAGATATYLANALLKSLETGQVVEFKQSSAKELGP